MSYDINDDNNECFENMLREQAIDEEISQATMAQFDRWVNSFCSTAEIMVFDEIMEKVREELYRERIYEKDNEYINNDAKYGYDGGSDE